MHIFICYNNLSIISRETTNVVNRLLKLMTCKSVTCITTSLISIVYFLTHATIQFKTWIANIYIIIINFFWDKSNIKPRKIFKSRKFRIITVLRNVFINNYCTYYIIHIILYCDIICLYTLYK